MPIFTEAITRWLEPYTARAMLSSDGFVAHPFGYRMQHDLLYFLVLELLDATDLVAFDIANRSNRCMRMTWLRALHGALDLRPLRGLLYTHFWIR